MQPRRVELKESSGNPVVVESMTEQMTFEMSLGIRAGMDVSSVGDSSSVMQTPAPAINRVSRIGGWV
jgi:hypothetical protein